MSHNDWVIWGSELSPFTLKLQVMASFKRWPMRLLPAQAGSASEALRYELRRRRLSSQLLPLTWPEENPLDEFPLVPFLFGPNGENLYDSSAIADWLDLTKPQPAINPEEQIGSAEIRFLNRFIDEFLDEWGIYLVHHNRWKVSADSNDAGQRLANEWRPILKTLPLVGRLAMRQFGQWFSARQVRRMPYLFSVASQENAIANVKPARQPPTREGFPATDTLLEDSCQRLLTALEPIYSQRNGLFGEQLSLADFSIYAQFAMNLADPEAANWIQAEAPQFFAWLNKIHRGEFVPVTALSYQYYPDLMPLLAEAQRVFVPLMQQNEAAYQAELAAGHTEFNEAAFNRGMALYDGELDGQPFRSVVKTFQVRVWHDLCDHYHSLTLDEQANLPFAADDFAAC